MPEKKVTVQVKNPKGLGPYLDTIAWWVVKLGIAYAFLFEQIYMDKETLPSANVMSHAVPAYSSGNCGEPNPRMEPAGVSPASTCVVKDPMESTVRLGRDLLFETHVMESLEWQACDDSDITCSAHNKWKKLKANEASRTSLPGCLQRSYFIAGVENFSIAFEHSLMSDASENMNMNQRNMHGRLIDQSGEELLAFPWPRRDEVPLHMLMLAAGLTDLDEPSDLVRKLSPCAEWQKQKEDACCEDFGNSSRARGIELKVDIIYSNMLWSYDFEGVFILGRFLGTFGLPPIFGFPTPHYTIKVSKKPMLEPYVFATNDGPGPFSLPFSMSYRKYRTITLLNGILVTATKHGEILHWDLLSFVGFLILWFTSESVMDKLVEIYVDNYMVNDKDTIMEEDEVVAKGLQKAASQEGLASPTNRQGSEQSLSSPTNTQSPSRGRIDSPRPPVRTCVDINSAQLHGDQGSLPDAS